MVLSFFEGDRKSAHQGEKKLTVAEQRTGTGFQTERKWIASNR